jgi:polyisoprenoid-binding protein YceI
MITTKNAFRVSMLPLLASLALTGCEDPAANKPKATVSSAKPTATAAASTTAAAATAEADNAAGAWTIAAADSKLEFVGSKVTGKHEGGFKTFSGVGKLADGKAEGGSVSVEIDMSSLYSDDDKLTGHLKGADFFDVETHPKAKFTSTEIKAGAEGDATHTITGNLELHGKTKSISFPATIKVEAGSATVSSEFSINRKDFDINYKGMPDDLIRDDVVIKLSLKLTKS